MARGALFSEVIQDVRSACRLSTSTSRGLDHLTTIKEAINRHYQMLWDAYDWPFLLVRKENAGKDISAGQRYYDVPTSMSMETVKNVWVLHGGTWIKLEYGITPEHYNAINSDDDARSDPPLRWQWIDDTQFEIWPMPDSNITNGLRFEGGRVFEPLVDDDDVCYMDKQLLVLYVAAEILAGNKQPDAEAKGQLAAARLVQMKKRTGTQTRVVFGQEDCARESDISLRAVYNDRTP